MKRCIFVASFVASFVGLCHAGTVALKWKAETSQAQAYQATIYRGETARLEAQLLSYGAALALPSNATASIYYQTNGMADAWWQGAATATTGGVVSADFTPAMDAGGTRYAFFLGVDGGGANYRANGLLNIRHAPGATPNALALPTRLIDFAVVTVSNPPWATAADVAAATSGISVAESDPLALAAISNLAVIATGGYATDVFWYPISIPYTVTGGTNIIEDDIYVTLASGSSKQDYLLSVEVDARPTVYSIDPPQVAWSLDATSAALGSISNNVLASSGTTGLARVYATGAGGETKALRVPITKPQGGSVLLKPAADVAGTFRAAVSTNLIALFAAADTNAASRYRFHRETTFGTNGVSTWTFPNSLQLYQAGGVNTDAHDPRVSNKTFAIPALADALRCVSSWRGDWYAHRPFIAVAPHYGISVAHWRQTNTWVPWCLDRADDTWMTNRLSVTGHEDPGRIGVYGDVSVHRFETAFPSNILMRLMRPAELAKLSPSLLNGAMGLTASAHNTVHPAQLQPFKPYNMSLPPVGHAPWSSYEAVFNPARWLPRDYAGIASLVHNTHLWDSGHLSAFWVNDVLVPVGTFTYASGGWNALLNDSLITSVSAIVEADSDGAETIGLITSEELQ